MADNYYPKIGLALGSGGAKGLAHIGVLKNLETYNIPIHAIAGASIGSLIGAYYAAHPDIPKLEELIRNFDQRKGFLLFDPILRGGLIKGNKIEKFIAEMVTVSDFSELKIPFAAVATDFNTAEKVILNKGNLVKAIRASISVPAIFQPIWYQDRLLADGGLSDPIPTEVVRDMGCDIVLAVNVENLYLQNPILRSLPLTKVPMHSMDILRHNLNSLSTYPADLVISPKIPPVGLVGWNYFFDTQKSQRMIKAGEDAMQQAIEPLQKLILSKQTEYKQTHGIRKYFTFVKRLLK